MKIIGFLRADKKAHDKTTNTPNSNPENTVMVWYSDYKSGFDDAFMMIILEINSGKNCSMINANGNSKHVYLDQLKKWSRNIRETIVPITNQANIPKTEALTDIFLVSYSWPWKWYNIGHPYH